MKASTEQGKTAASSRNYQQAIISILHICRRNVTLLTAKAFILWLDMEIKKREQAAKYNQGTGKGAV